MDELARNLLLDMVNEVMDAEPGKFEWLSICRGGGGKVTIRRARGELEYKETRPWSEVAEAVTRAKEATDD